MKEKRKHGEREIGEMEGVREEWEYASALVKRALAL